MWVLFSLMAALATGVVVTLSKNGIKNVDPMLGFAIESVLIIIVAWGFTIGRGKLSGIGEIDKRSWIFLILAGILTCVSSLCSFQALKMGEASRTSSLERASLVFSVLFAVIFLKERINWQVIVGVVMMAAGAVIIAFAKKA